MALAAKGAWVLPLLAPKPNPELGVEGKELLALLKEKVVGLKFAPGEDDAAAEDILPPVAPAEDAPKLKPPAVAPGAGEVLDKDEGALEPDDVVPKPKPVEGEAVVPGGGATDVFVDDNDDDAAGAPN